MTEGILFCTPCYGGQVTEPHFSSCLQLKEALTNMGVPHGWYTLGNESLITRARNNCARFFLEKTDFSHMMFLDADIEFVPDDVGKLWSMNKDVAVGVYRMKKPDSAFAAWVDGKLVEDIDLYDAPLKVDYAGTGFMMIKRPVFESIRKATPHLAHEDFDGPTHAFFDTAIEDGVCLSEDFFFCKRFTEINGEIWMDPTVKLKHHGSCAYG